MNVKCKLHSEYFDDCRSGRTYQRQRGTEPTDVRDQCITSPNIRHVLVIEASRRQQGHVCQETGQQLFSLVG